MDCSKVVAARGLGSGSWLPSGFCTAVYLDGRALHKFAPDSPISPHTDRFNNIQSHSSSVQNEHLKQQAPFHRQSLSNPPPSTPPKMPSLRGIEVSIVTQSSVGTLPEYPHPDEPCYQEPCAYKAPKDGQPAACAPDQQDATENDPDLSHKASPRISVYVPSIPGTWPPSLLLSVFSLFFFLPTFSSLPSPLDFLAPRLVRLRSSLIHRQVPSSRSSMPSSARHPLPVTCSSSYT